MKFRAMNADDWQWVKEKAHVIQCEDTQGITAYDERGIQAVAAFDSFTVDACNAHIAIDNPLVIRRGFLCEAFRHLFVTCHRNRVFGLVPSNNDKALKFDEHIGMVEVGRIPNALSEGVDYVVMCMTKDACRWIPQQMKRAA